MLTDYPARAQTWETLVQMPSAFSFLVVLGYAGISGQFSEDEAEATARINAILPAMKILGVTFALAISAGFLRRWTRDPPLALIWAALLASAAVACTCGVLLFLSAI